MKCSPTVVWIIMMIMEAQDGQVPVAYPQEKEPDEPQKTIPLNISLPYCQFGVKIRDISVPPLIIYYRYFFFLVTGNPIYWN